MGDVGPLADLAQRNDVFGASADGAPVPRRASSRSLSDCDSQSARFRPRSHWSRTTAATCRPLPQPVPSPSIQPRRKRTGSDSGSSASTVLPSCSEAGADFIVVAIAVGVDALHGLRHECLPAGADAVLGGEVFLVRLAGEDDALELGVGQLSLGHDALGQDRAVGRHGVRHRRHGAGLHQRRRVLDRPRHVDARCPPSRVGVRRVAQPRRNRRRPAPPRRRAPRRGPSRAQPGGVSFRAVRVRLIRVGRGAGACPNRSAPGTGSMGRRAGTVPVTACKRWPGVAHRMAGIDPCGLVFTPVEHGEAGVEGGAAPLRRRGRRWAR